MRNEYEDYWANLEDAHMLTRLRIGPFIVNVLQANGYERKADAKEKDVFHMGDEAFLSYVRKFYNNSLTSKR